MTRINSETLRSARELLCAVTDDLQRNYPALPVPVGRICADLGMQVRFSQHLGKFSAQLEMPQDRGPIITLSGRHGGEAWERFCIAHELAHFYLIKHLAIRPSHRSDHWKVEDLADEFARQLLVPQSSVKELLSGRQVSAISMLRSSRQLCDFLRVPWMAVFKRITQLDVHHMGFRIGAVGGRFRVIASSDARNRGRGKNVPNQSRLHSFLIEHAADQSGNDLSVQPAMLADLGIIEFAVTDAALAVTRFAEAIDYSLVAMGEGKFARLNCGQLKLSLD